MNESNDLHGNSLCRALDIKPHEAAQMLAEAVQWRGESAWEASIGTHIRFSGGFALDDAMKADVLRMIADRVDVIFGLPADTPCQSIDGSALTAEGLRADILMSVAKAAH